MTGRLQEYPHRVTLVEVGPRDGLQNETLEVPTEIKLELIDRLVQAGLKTIEATSFVSPKWVPQMADAAAVMRGLGSRFPQVDFPVLTPNMRGFEHALAAGAQHVAVFAAASESFSQRNINCSIAASLGRFEPLLAAAKAQNIRVRGYISCVLGCPYEGAVKAQKVLDTALRMLDMGCYEISLGDTIGTGTAASTARLLDTLLRSIPAQHLAVHFHDTYGQALANILIALQRGIRVIDSAVAGLGGCPYAKGASGNVATEDVVYMLDGLGIEHGVELNLLVDAGKFISTFIGRSPTSKAAQAIIAKNAFTAQA